MATPRTKSAKNDPAKLLAALASVDPKARRRAAGALGNLGDAAAVPPPSARGSRTRATSR